jgi:hypothetical protein
VARFIIHAGFPKCGSTAIFKGLETNFDIVSRQNFQILNRNFKPATSIANLLPPLWELEATLKDPEAAKKAKRQIRRQLEAADADASIILSSENLANVNMPMNLAVGLDKKHDVTIIFYLRPQIDWIPSAWKQWEMRMGNAINQTVSRYIKSRRPAYLAVVQAWHQALPKAKIVVRPIISSELVGGDILQDFCHHAGIPDDAVRAFAPASEERVNPSVDHSLMHVMMSDHKRFFRIRRDSSFMHRLVSVLPDRYNRTNAPMLSEESNRAIYTAFLEDNRQLARDYMGVSDPDPFLEHHFMKNGVTHSYETTAEDQVLKRAQGIIEEVFGVSAPIDRLPAALREAVDACPVARA